MQKQKSENLMLNKSYRFLLMLIFIFQLAACSVTPEGTSSNHSYVIKNENYLEAIAAMKSGEIEKARSLFLDVIKQQPELENAHVNIGIIFIKTNSFEEAENAFNRVLNINKNNIYALNQLGFLYRTQGDFSKAKTSYEKAINVNSDYAYAHLNLGILYDLYLYDLESAIEQYEIYNKLSPEPDKQVEKWIFDLKRRHKKSLAQK